MAKILSKRGIKPVPTTETIVDEPPLYIYTADAEVQLSPAEMESIRRSFELIREQLDKICRSTICHPLN